MGDVYDEICNHFGESLGHFKLSNVVSLKQGFNLFTWPWIIQDGWTLGGNKNSIWMTKGKKRVVFDTPISTNMGVLFAGCFHREINMVSVQSDSLVKMKYVEYHDLLGHTGEEATKKKAKYLGIKIFGEALVCEVCAVGKAKQKSMPQVTHSDPLQPGEFRVELCLYYKWTENGRLLSVPNQAHEKALLRILEYCSNTPKLLLAPDGKLNGKDKKILFHIRGKSNNEFS